MAEIDLIERLRERINTANGAGSGDYAVGYYGLIDRKFDRLLLDDISRLRGREEEYRKALETASKALEYSISSLDGVVALDDEDMGTDGGSSACQATIKINRRALAKIAEVLS